MSEYGWSHARSHMQDLSRQLHGGGHVRRKPNGSAQNIACRLCDQVFLSTQDLITHVEFHMREDSSRSGAGLSGNPAPPLRDQTMRSLFINPNLSPPVPSPPVPPPETRSRGFPLARDANPNFSTPQKLHHGSSPVVRPQPRLPCFVQAKSSESNHIDLITMPYLDQLEQPIRPGRVHLLAGDEDRGNILDLSLKL